MSDTNYGFISQRPLDGVNNNLLQLNLLPGSQEVAQQLVREQEMSDLEACVLMDRDEAFAKQAREAYGKPLPLTGDPSSDYLFGSKLVRTLGIERCPEQYFIQQGLPVPRTKGRKELYPYVAKHFREDAHKRQDTREQEQEQANMAAEFFESRVNMPKYGTEEGYTELVMEVARRMPENRRGGWLEQAEEFWKANKDILHANVRQAELEKKHGTIKEAKWSAWARPQLLDWARDLAAIRKENPKAYEVILGRMVEEAKKNTGNAAENVYMGLPVQAIVNLMDEVAKMEKGATDVNLFMNATGTPSVGMPGMHLSTTGYTPEQRKAREVPAWYESVSKEDMEEMNTLINTIRGMRGGHGEGAWDISFAPVNGWLKRNVGFDLGTDSTRDLLASAAASTAWFALTRGAGTLLSTSGEKGYELLANGSSHDSAIVRGFGEGAVQTAAEGIFGIGGRFTPLRSVAGRAVSKVAHMHPVTRKSIGSLLVGGNKIARYGRGWSAAARNKMWRSALARFGADTLVGAGEEMAEELFGIWAGTYLDTALAKRAGETNTESFNKATGEYEPFKAALRQTGELVTNGAAWLSFLGMGAGFSGLRLPSYRYDRKIATASAPELVAMGVSPSEAPRIASIADPEKRKAEALRAGALGRVATEQEVEHARRFVAGDMSAFEDYALYDVLSKTGVLPTVKPALHPDGSRKRDKQGRELWTYSDKRGSIDMTEDAASEAMAGAMLKLNAKQQAVLADMVVARALINKLTDTEGVVTENVGQRMDADYFMALADAARVRIEEGAAPDSIDPDIDPGMELGQVAALGAAWQNRLNILRHDEEQRLGRPLTEEEFANIKKKASSPVNRQFSRKRQETLFRFVRGEISVATVLEDIIEDSIDRDMRRTQRSEAFYVDSIKQLESELGKVGQFLEEKNAYSKQDIIEALGKIVESKVLADTAKKDNGLSDWVNDFLDLLRKWVGEVIAFVKLGNAINQVLSDEQARERLGDDFVGMVENLAHQNTEFMKGLQREGSLRYTLDAATRKPSPTPTLTAAMETHGEQVKAEAEELERQHKALSEDVREAVEPDLSASVEQIDEIKALQAEEDALEFLRKGEFEYADLRTGNRAGTQEAASGSSSQGAADGDADARAGAEVQRGEPVRRSEPESEELHGHRGLLPSGRALRNLASRVHRFHGETKAKAEKRGFYTGHLYELRQDDAEAAQAFADCINAAKVSRGVLGDCVYTYEEEEYRQMRLFLTPDGKAGIALKQNGDMVSVFTHREQKESLGGKTVHSLIELAINEGAVKADCYGSFLVKLYGKHGFRAIAKDAFNAEFATESMKNRATMLANFPKEDGKPDVVYLTYMGNRETGLDDFNAKYTPTYQDKLGYSDYDTCCATQDAGVKECRKIEALPAEVKQPVLDATSDVDLRHFGLKELARVKSERNRKRAVDMVHAASILQGNGVDVFTEAGRQEAENMAEYAARCKEQLAARALKEKGETMQARVLATAARWERWTELDDLKGEAARWDGKARVTPRLVEAPADDAGFSSAVTFSPSEAEGLKALLNVAHNGQPARFRSDTLGEDIEIMLGSAGKFKNPDNPNSKIVGASGLMHLITMRMAHGESMEEAAYTACKAVMAAVNGRVVAQGEKWKQLLLDEYNSVIYLKWFEERKTWLATGYKESGEHSSADDKRRAKHLAESYAVNQFGCFEELGAALERAIARLAREYKSEMGQYPLVNISHSVSVAREVDIMQDGKLEAANGTLYDMSGASFAILARHASPHSGIRKFLMEFIGTGEGNQVFGRGLYFSTSEEVHQSYVRQFQIRGSYPAKNKLRKMEGMAKFHADDFIDDLRAGIKQSEDWVAFRDDYIAYFKKEAKESISGIVREAAAKAAADFEGVLLDDLVDLNVRGASEYEVLLNIDRNGENLLRWDEPAPQDLIERLGMSEPMSDFYKPKSRKLWVVLQAQLGSGRAATEALLAAGIKGVEYRDATSRKSDEDVTYNYVMFDEADIKVVRVKDAETGYEWQDYEDADATFSTNLAAVHSLSRERFLEAATLGGMPMPSIAVTRLDKPYAWGGDDNIYLVGEPSLVDPEQGNVQVGTADLYSGTFPKLKWGKIDYTKFDALKEQYLAILKKYGFSRFEAGYFERALDENNKPYFMQQMEEYAVGRMLFAAHMGYMPRRMMREYEAQSSLGADPQFREEVRDLYYNDGDSLKHSLDVYAAYIKAAERAVERAEAASKADPDNEQKQERAKKLRRSVASFGLSGSGLNAVAGSARLVFTDMVNAGRRVPDREGMERRFKEYAAKHKKEFKAWLREMSALWSAPRIEETGEPATLANLTRVMRANKGQGKERGVVFGTGLLRAQRARMLTSLAEMKGMREDIVSSDELAPFTETTKKLASEYVELAMGDMGSFRVADAAMQALAKKHVKPTPTSVCNALRSALGDRRLGQGSAVVQKGVELLKALENEPVDYLEAVPMRAVTMNEWKVAVLPKSMKKDEEVQAVLQSNGITPRYHDGTKEGREKAMRRLVNNADVSFSVSSEDGQRIAREFNALEKSEGVRVSVPEVFVLPVAKARAHAREMYRVLQQETQEGNLPLELPNGIKAIAMGKGFREVKHHSADRRVLAAACGLRALCRKSIYINSAPNSESDKEGKADIVRFHYYIAKACFEGAHASNPIWQDEAYVSIVIAEDAEGNCFYDLNTSNEEQIINEKAISEELPTTRVTNTAMTEPGMAYGGRILKTKKFVNYINAQNAQQVEADFSGAVRFLDSATTGHGGLTEERMAFAQTIAENMRKMLGDEIARFRTFDGKAHGSREKALVAIGSVYNMARSVAMLMPEGYRVNVRPWLNQLQVFAELAASGKLDLTADMASQDLRGMYEAHGSSDGKSNPMVEWHSKLVQEHGNEKVNEVLAKILSKVGDKLTKMERDAAVESIKNLLKRLEPQRDPKTGKLKRGIMSAEGYDEVAHAAEAMQMSAEELDAKLTALEASIAKAQEVGNEDEVLRLQGLHTLYSTYGDVKSMSLAQVVAAYENLQELVKWNRWAWDEALAGRRFEQLRVVDETVRGLGGMPSLNAEHSARMEKPIGKRLRRVGDVLKSFPQVLATLDKVGAGALADSLRTRLNTGMEGIKTAERERWVKIEAVSRKTLGKSWRKCMNMLHEVQQTGIPFDQPLHRSVTLSRAYAQELVEMTPEQRKAEWKKNEAMGGSMALARYSEEAVAAMEEELAKGGRSKDITVRFVEEMRHVDNLELSKGQAMYALLMYEQPTYTEQMQAQGYTEEFMEKLRTWMGEEVIAFAYGLRDIVAENTPKLKAVYERQFGVPFPAEENYFPARWIVPQQNDELMTALAGFGGAPGASTGFLKPRVLHGHPLDTTKDALQVMLQAMTLSDAWMHTQDIVADLNAYMRDRKFDAAMVTALGKDGYANFKAWVELLKNGGARQVVDMGAAQSWVDRMYGASAMAVLGFRIQTLFRQFGAIFNGLMGAYDISTAEFVGSLVRQLTGKAPMSYRRMVQSDFIRNRKTGHQGTLQGQAMRPSGEMVSSFEAALEMAMRPMEEVDSRLTASGLVPVWNAYYRRAVKAGASEAEATQDAWERTIECANRASQPIGWVNKTKLAQDRSITSRAVMFMLSEDLNKMGLCMSLWGGGHYGKAMRAWMVYGACNALISAMLDALCGDPDDWEKAHWWEYVVSAIYGPLASCPGVGEAVEALGTLLLQGVGNVAGIEELAKAKTHASVGRAFIDVQGTYKAGKKLYEMLTDDDEYALADYSKQVTRASRPASVLLGATGTGVGYGLLFLQTLMNPVDFGARVWEAHGGEE